MLSPISAHVESAITAQAFTARPIIAVIATIAVFGAVSEPAQGQASIVWSYDAMACQPAGAPIVSDLHDSLAGAVRFKDGKVGNIALICPVSENLGKTMLRSLRLTYRDGDGHQGASEVRAAIRRVNRSDGNVTTLTNGEVRSNDGSAPNSGPTGWATHQSGGPGEVLNHSLDFQEFYYYVQINLSRKDPKVPIAVMGAHLVD